MKPVKIQLYLKIFSSLNEVFLKIPCLKDMRKRYSHILPVGIEIHVTILENGTKYLLNFKACAFQDLAIPLNLTLEKCLHPRRHVQNIENSVV